MDTFFDIHTHFFNEHYAIRSALSGFWDRIIENQTKIFPETTKEGILELQGKYREAKLTQRQSLVFVALTYNLDFLFQKYYGDPQLSVKKFIYSTLPDDVDKYIKEAIKKYSKVTYYDTLKEILKVKDEIDSNPDKYENLQLYLFYYFDPRWSGSLDFVKQYVRKKGESKNSKKFIGIKLYPPNGYSPLDPTMLELYDYCQREQIPITVHYSQGGFATFTSQLELRGDIFVNGTVKKVKGTYMHEFKHKLLTKDGRLNIFRLPNFTEAIEERVETLNHPMLWYNVLERFPELRINFAHFGLGNNKFWKEAVLQFIDFYPYVYTDIACSDKNNFVPFWKEVSNRNLTHKVLFGSDFPLNKIAGVKIEEMLDFTTKSLTTEKLALLTFNNPKNFLRFDQDKEFDIV